MAASDKKEMLVMVLRPTIFRVEANSFEDAKKTITNQLIASGQMKPDAPIEFREMIDYELKNKTEEENKQEDKKDDNGNNLYDQNNSGNDKCNFRISF